MPEWQLRNASRWLAILRHARYKCLTTLAMLYRLLRPLIFRLDPEDAHDRALGAAAMLAARPALAKAVRQCLVRHGSKSHACLGLSFPSRVGLAAGFDKNAVAPLAWWALGFGFVELGTITPRPQSGHARPRMFRFANSHALVNRMGFNNHGADAVAARLARSAAIGQRPPMPIGISVGKNADTPLDRAVDDYASAAQALAPHADFISMNVSSPNTANLRDLQQRGPIMALVRAVRGAAGGKPVLVKVAPELAGIPLADMATACIEAGAAGLIATNTLSTRGRAALPEGGLSGRPLRIHSRRRVAELRALLGDGPAIIGCGGIDTPRAAQDMIDAGADLLQVYSGLIFEGPMLANRLCRACDDK